MVHRKLVGGYSGLSTLSPHSYSSESTYETALYGGVDDQMKNTFSEANSNDGNHVAPLPQNTVPASVPMTTGLASLVGGRRRRSGRKSAKKSMRHRKRGGSLMGVAATAATPLALLALQQSYKRRKHSKKNKRSNKKRSMRRRR
jgi:hypothetical protein